ncbi:GIY-YIG nuclease family protein [Echinicola sp. 20G]|uniref:GIY-YIG nuclease family protein n=1 Tax=Echinicola sp. 20G TaxID=2781961 RepID=UPI001910C842
MYTVYAISSEKRNYIYVGLTANLEDRLHRHNLGYERTTKPYRPFRLIYKKIFTTRLEARDHEKYLKGTSGKRFLMSGTLIFSSSI